MYWAVRGTDPITQEDLCIVIEADNSARAEYVARRRNFPVICVCEATAHEIQCARNQHLLYQHTPLPRYFCFGHPLSPIQLAAIVLCGIGTIALHLRHLL